MRSFDGYVHYKCKPKAEVLEGGKPHTVTVRRFSTTPNVCRDCCNTSIDVVIGLAECKTSAGHLPGRSATWSSYEGGGQRDWDLLQSLCQPHHRAMTATTSVPQYRS